MSWSKADEVGGAGGADGGWCDLPAVEVVASGALTAAECRTNQPHDEEDDRGDPQQVEGESRTKEEQDEQEGDKEDHAEALPLTAPG